MSPAPWTFVSEHAGEQLLIVGPDGDTVIAHVCDADDGPVLAAAPELLEACKRAAQLLPMCSCDNGVFSPSGDSEGDHWLSLLEEEICAAIAKAEGGER